MEPVPVRSPQRNRFPSHSRCHERIAVRSFGGCMVARNAMTDSSFAY
jgi:hypothetical protein